MTPERGQGEEPPRFDYALLDCIELANGCVIQISDKFRNALSKEERREFFNLWGAMRCSPPLYLQDHPEISTRVNEITQTHFGISMDDMENAMIDLRQAYKEAKKDPVESKEKIQAIITKYGCDFAPYVPTYREPDTRPFKERLEDFSKQLSHHQKS